MCNVKMNHLDASLQDFIVAKDDEITLAHTRSASMFPLGDGQALFIRTSWTRHSASIDIIITDSSLSVDEAFYGICENMEITGRCGLKGLSMAMSMIQEIMKGVRTITIVPSDDRRESAYRRLEKIGFHRTRIGTYVYE